VFGSITSSDCPHLDTLFFLKSPALRISGKNRAHQPTALESRGLRERPTTPEYSTLALGLQIDDSQLSIRALHQFMPFLQSDIP
jgi:hypothetical protein